MKILAPFNQASLLNTMADSGVQEFYMGFYDEQWSAKYGKYSDINRLSLFKESANRYRIEDMEAIARDIHRLGGELYITFNAPDYHEEQYKRLETYIEILSGYQVDGIITGVSGLIPYIHKYHMKAVASTMCGIYNSDMAALYKRAGADRIIFPREVSLAEMESIIRKVPGVEYEAFLMRNGCRYSDSNCLGLHGGECGALCSSIRHGRPGFVAADEYAYGVKEQVLYTHDIYSRYFHEFSCGQCAVWKLLHMGINAVKIVGRLDNMKEIALDAQITRGNIEIASECESQEEYLDKMVLPGDLQEYCRGGLSCYYPEARFGGAKAGDGFQMAGKW